LVQNDFVPEGSGMEIFPCSEEMEYSTENTEQIDSSEYDREE
jgi:hypothetical protein